MAYKLLIMTLVVLLTACSALAPTNDTPPPETKVFVDEHNQLHYDGGINEDANLRIFELYQSLQTKPNTLEITSKGGSVIEGMKLGNWVFDHQLDVVVGRGCASSCANYVFPAGQKKFLHKDSVLIWHGNSYQDDVSELYAVGNKSALEFRNKENAFYKRINVHPLLGEYGHKDFSIWNRLYHYFKGTVGYDYSIEDMKKFGITNIQLIDNAWEWRKYKSEFYVLRVKVDAEELEQFKYH